MIFNLPNDIGFVIVTMTPEEAKEIMKTLHYAKSRATGFEPKAAETMRLGLRLWLGIEHVPTREEEED